MQKKPQTPNKFLACDTANLHRNAPNKGALGEYVLEGDLPHEFTKQFLDNTSVEYVPFFTERNNMYNQIFNAVMTSPTNAAILQKKNKMVCGDGLHVVAKQGIVLHNDAEPTDAELMAIDEYLGANFTPYSCTVLDELKKVTADFNSFGNGLVLLKKIKSGGTRKFYQEHVPFGWGRIRKIQGNEMQPTRIGISQKWDTLTQFPPDLKEYPLYPTFENIDGVECSILHIKDYAVGFKYYGVPAYVASLLHCEMEYRIAKFNQSSFDNGFMPSGILQFFGNMSPEEAQTMLDRVNSKMTGTGNNAKLLLQVMADESMKANYTAMSDIKDGAWLELGQIARENIITAHEWTQALAGMGIAGQLGSNQQIRAEFEIVQNTVIRPIQSTILGQWLNKTLKDAAIWTGASFGNNELKILNNTPVSFAGDLVISNVLTLDEQRELLGYESNEIENGNDTN